MMSQSAIHSNCVVHSFSFKKNQNSEWRQARERVTQLESDVSHPVLLLNRNFDLQNSLWVFRPECQVKAMYNLICF
ncbi:hypothetical protein PGT21_008123 [Puccinia graminis f. sp. tritici]|uniref:Uncharacterized protein n=1 Tax=Puccinia graminis f. sp. tritici TaxID=56615 RepID=A0A5B0NZY1_PUCGR|nr:hypothetical protein PGT21_008123 [Puccinia graminis f. sp. tritici]